MNTIQPLRALPSETSAIDRGRAERAAAELLDALGVDLGAEATSETPRRMVDVYAELLTRRRLIPTTFPNEGDYDELVVARADPVPLAVRAPPAALRRRRLHRLPAGRADHRALEARPGGRPLRPRPAGPGAAHHAGRPLARARARAAGESAWCSRPSTCACRCAASQKPGATHRDLGAAGPGARRPEHTPGVPRAGRRDEPWLAGRT